MPNIPQEIQTLTRGRSATYSRRMGRKPKERPEGLPPLAKNVFRLRTARGLTQPDVAEATGISQGAISKMERGDSKQITHEQLQKLAVILGVTVADLYTDPAGYDTDPSFAAFLASDFATGMTEDEKLELSKTQWGSQGAPPAAWYHLLQAVRLRKASGGG